MGYEFVETSDGLFAVDFSLVHRIARDYAYAEAWYANSRRTTISQSEWYNPFSWALPDFHRVETDYPKARRQRDATTAELMHDFRWDVRAAKAQQCGPFRVSFLEWRDTKKEKALCSPNTTLLSFHLAWQVDQVSRLGPLCPQNEDQHQTTTFRVSRPEMARAISFVIPLSSS